MSLGRFVTELRRRRVFRVAVVYAVVAFVILQVADLLVPALVLPDWTFRLVAFLLLLGLPVALVLAWALELTPEGVRRAEPGSALAAGGDGTDGGATSPFRSSRVVFYGGVAGVVGVGILLLFLRGGPGSDPIGVPAPAASGELVSIAVLPFANLDPDPEREYFSDGITADLITNLSLIDGFQVISRTSAMRYKQSELSIPEIARELGVDHVVGGSVRRDGNQVRINAELLDAARDAHLWAERYDREVTGIFEVQAEIAERIADALAQSLSPGDRSRIVDAGTFDPVALDLLHRGWGYLHRPGGRADLGRYELALEFFHRALEVDPDYARAYVAIAETYRLHVALPAGTVRRDSILAYAGRAAELDPELPEALTELGFAHLFRTDEWDRARTLFGRALELDGSQATAMEGLGRLAVLEGSLAEGIRWQRRALQVDPRSAERLARLGDYLFDIGDLDGAEAHFREATSLQPDNPEIAFLLASVLLIRGEQEGADEVMDLAAAAAGGSPAVPAATAQYLVQLGRYEEAEELLAGSPVAGGGALAVFRALNLQRLGKEERAAELVHGPGEILAEWDREGLFVPPRGRLSLHLFHGEREAALATIRRYWRTGLRYVEDPPAMGIYWLDQDPLVEELRDDAGFQALMREIRGGFDRLRAELEGDPGARHARAPTRR